MAAVSLLSLTPATPAAGVMSVVRLFTMSTVSGAEAATPAERSPVQVTVPATVTQPAETGCGAQQSSAQAAAELNRSVFRLEDSASRARRALFLAVLQGALDKGRRKDIIPFPNTLKEFAKIRIKFMCIYNL
jgi:hypothetical protein